MASPLSLLQSGCLLSLLVCIDNLLPGPSGRDSDLKAWAIELPDKDGITPSESGCLQGVSTTPIVTLEVRTCTCGQNGL